MLYTLDDLRFLLDKRIVRLEVYYDMVKECPYLQVRWQIPDSLMALLNEHKDELVDIYNVYRAGDAPVIK